MDRGRRTATFTVRGPAGAQPADLEPAGLGERRHPVPHPRRDPLDADVAAHLGTRVGPEGRGERVELGRAQRADRFGGVEDPVVAPRDDEVVAEPFE